MNDRDEFFGVCRKAKFAVGLILLFYISFGSAFSQTPTPTPALPRRSSLSPDKQWEYRCDDGVWSSIVKTGANRMVLDLSNEVEVPYCQDAQVIWAPDSKRFAFNYSPPHAPHSTYETVAFYQLQGDRWVALPSPVDGTSDQTQLAQLTRGQLQKNGSACRVDPNRDILKVREWSSADTALLYAPCYKSTSGQLEAAFLFTLNFGDAGHWKILKTQRLSEKELEQGAN